MFENRRLGLLVNLSKVADLPQQGGHWDGLLRSSQFSPEIHLFLVITAYRSLPAPSCN